jgi:hypothetical protein
VYVPSHLVPLLKRINHLIERHNYRPVISLILPLPEHSPEVRRRIAKDKMTRRHEGPILQGRSQHAHFLREHNRRHELGVFGWCLIPGVSARIVSGLWLSRNKIDEGNGNVHIDLEVCVQQVDVVRAQIALGKRRDLFDKRSVR